MRAYLTAAIKKQVEYFAKIYAFLIVQNKILGCKSCREGGSLGTMQTGKLRYIFSSEWQNCRVDLLYMGPTKRSKVNL